MGHGAMKPIVLMVFLPDSIIVSMREGGGLVENAGNQRHRNTALLLIGAGLFILLYNVIGAVTLIALSLIMAGVHRIRAYQDRKGFIIAIIGAVVIISSHFIIVLAALLLSLGFFYMKSKQMHQDGTYEQKHSLVESCKRDKEPWVLRNMSMWNIVGEMHLDLTLAMPEQEETTLVLQGILGDVDVIVPEDYGLHVSASVTFGKLTVMQQQEIGVLNKSEWKSPDYEQRETKIRLIIYYAVGDVDIKLI